MKVDGCPDRETLERHILGKLSKLEHDRVGEHLLHCDQCATAASTIGAGDRVTEAVLSRPVRSDDGRVLVEARDHDNEIHSQSETATTGETITFDQDEAAHEHEYDMSTVPAHVDFLNPPQQPDEIGRLGNYRVLEVIGVGGMGLVFRGEDPNLKRLVALKAMKPAIAAGKAARDRFLQEAQATAAIEHHNIVHIYEVAKTVASPSSPCSFCEASHSKSDWNEKGNSTSVT